MPGRNFLIEKGCVMKLRLLLLCFIALTLVAWLLRMIPDDAALMMMGVSVGILYFLSESKPA